MNGGRRWVVACIVAWSGWACGPKVDEDGAGETETGELPASCDREPYDEACEVAFAAMCEARLDATSCGQAQWLPGGLSLECLWIEPSAVVLEGNACTVEPAEPRCVGVASPGDIGCTMWLEEGEETLVISPAKCFPIGWNDCSVDGTRECGCPGG